MTMAVTEVDTDSIPPTSPDGSSLNELPIETIQRIQATHAALKTPKCLECQSYMEPCSTAQGFWVCVRCSREPDQQR